MNDQHNDQEPATDTQAVGAPTDQDVAEAAAPPPFGTFEEMGLGPEVLKAIKQMGFAHPMEVQARCAPVVLKGRDLMVQSRTGSGKTAAFGIPLIDRVVNPDEKFVQALILLPTRELALQVAAEMGRLAAFKESVVVPIYGGAPMGRQIEQLKAGAQIVCGTPGRILDHLRRGTLKLDRVKCAVLDECDEMLSMGFQEDIEAILEHTPENRQTLLFSATVPEGIQRLAKRFMHDPEHLKLSADFVGVHEIEHLYYSVSGADREKQLLRILDFQNPGRTIIFCNTREETGRIADFLRSHGRDAEAISSDLSQSDREKVMARMRAGSIQFMVATDVAARGIDLDDITHVFNYTFPDSPEVYIHRTGRTGRAGRHGIAVSLIGPTEVGAFYYLKLLYKIKPQERTLPSEIEIRSRREGERIEALREAFPDEPGPGWRSLARRLTSALDGERLLAALLAARLGEARPTPAVGTGRTAEPERSSRPPRDREPLDQGERERDRSGPSRGRERPQLGQFDRGDRDRPRHARGDGDRPRYDRGDRDRPRHDRGGERGGERDRDRPVPARGPQAEGAPPAASEAEFGNVWSEGSSGGGEAPVTAPPGKTRLYLNLGRKDQVSADDIATLANSVGITLPLHDIEIMNTHSYLNVESDSAQKLSEGLAAREHNGRRIVCEAARPMRR